MPNILNRKHGIPPVDAVYIGRPSKWGNPFLLNVDGDRTEIVKKHKAWVLSQPALIEDIKRELKGKDLVCFCVPKKCHGKILLEIANEE